jgi:[ribosomal protein S5]-alanine N-acetyltransferase
MNDAGKDIPGHLRLSTPRLDLVAATFDHICAELESPQCLGRLLNARVEGDWPPGQYDRGAQEFFRDRLQEDGPAAIGWYTWYALRRSPAGEPPVLVGAGGYLGEPDETGQVEIGFSMVARRQGHGYATEMVTALVARSLADSRVRKIVAHTTMDNPASRRVLEKTGFRPVSAAEPSGDILFERYPQP